MLAIILKESKESGEVSTSPRYGCPEAVEAAFKKKLDSFPKLSHKDKEKLYDILSEIESVMDITTFILQHILRCDSYSV